MDRKQLLEILELDISASTKDIENAFYHLAKRARSEENIDMDSITKAYNTLTNKEKITEKQKKAGRKKVNRKNLLIGILVIIIFISIIGLLYLTRARVDVNINYLGAYYKVEANNLGVEIKKSDNIKSVFIYSTFMKDLNSELLQEDMAGNILFLNEFERAKMDIIILDDFTYDYFKDKDIFIDLSSYLTDFGLDINDSRLIKYNNKIIGIDMTDNTYVQSVSRKEYTMFLVIGKYTKNIEKCLDVIEFLLN